MVLDLRQNGGKAEAVRQGVQASLEWKPFDFVGYFDADLSTPLREIPYILSHFNEATDVAFGSRVKRLGTVIERNPARHYLGRVFSTFSSLILDIPVYDTQCGAKIFRSETARRIFADPFLTRWLFDIELFGRMILESGRDSMGQRAIEVPLHQWVEVGKSKLKFSYLVKVPLELLRIRSYLLRKENKRQRAL
jgi:glycosyltransferase involved in cell wall biosynthesis